MYGTGMGGYLDRQRNEELSREIGTLRLEARLRSSRQHRTTPRQRFQIPVRLLSVVRGRAIVK